MLKSIIYPNYTYFHLVLLCYLLLGTPHLTGQKRLTIPVSNKTTIYKIELSDVEPFLAYTFTWEGGSATIKVRFSKDKTHWTNWILLPKDEHVTHLHKSQLATTDKEQAYFEIEYESEFIQNIKGHFYNPGETPPIQSSSPPIVGLRSDECLCMQPTFLNRQQWCPDGDCLAVQPPTATDITHIIIHHSAGTNAANDWAAIVRAIYNDHISVNGWDDIGYNWLIDPNGVVYEGRGYRTQGAHFCGKNSNTTGICILGNFQNRPPSGAAINSLIAFLAWQSCDAGIFPLDNDELANTNEIFNRISGHRDGCSTVCPGNQFYPQLAGIRLEVDEALVQDCGVVTAVEDRKSVDPGFSVYPNPVSDGVMTIEHGINIPDAAFVEVFASDGRLIQRSVLNRNLKRQSIKIPVRLSGVYFVKLGKFTKRMVVY